VLKLSGTLSAYYNLCIMSNKKVCKLVFIELCRSAYDDKINYVKQQLNITINIHSNNEQAFIYAYFDCMIELIKYLLVDI
jgi:hypothetical protein